MSKEIQLLNARIKNCKKCPLWKSRANAVPGEGSPRAGIMFIGESPGSEEDRQGRPFVGRAGKLLDELLASIKLKRDKVFITNIVKCRPPRNRLPKSAEIAKCTLTYLDKQIKLIKPKIICTLGAVAAKHVLEIADFRFRNMAAIHGKVLNTREIKIIPLYHPAVVVRNARKKVVLMRDFRAIAKLGKTLHIKLK